MRLARCRHVHLFPWAYVMYLSNTAVGRWPSSRAEVAFLWFRWTQSSSPHCRAWKSDHPQQFFVVDWPQQKSALYWGMEDTPARASLKELRQHIHHHSGARDTSAQISAPGLGMLWPWTSYSTPLTLSLLSWKIWNEIMPSKCLP